MSDQGTTPTLEAYISDRIREEADELTDRWIDHLSEELGVRPSRLLPSEKLRDHIPLVIESIADFAVVPAEVVKSDVVGRLRLLAELRREQGYDIQELLTEFDTLSKLVFERFRAMIEAYPGGADPVRVAELAGRLRETLAGMVAVTIGVYEQEETEQKREFSERLSEYASTIAHELKNPLNAAYGGARMLREGQIDQDQQKHFVDLVLRSLERVTELIEDVRILAVEEHAEAEPRWVMLAEVLEDVFAEVREVAKDKDVRLEIEGDLPEIKVDARRVEVALMNLVANAVKYSDPEKEERWVRVAAEPAKEDPAVGGGWTIRVADNGLGIPKDLQSNVFQRHFRAHPEVAEGTGLGLALTHEVVTQRGGSIEFESTEGEGTTFYVTIPERQEEPERRAGKRQP